LCIFFVDSQFDPWTFTAASPELQEAIDAAVAEVEPSRELYAGQFGAFHRAITTGATFPVTLADARSSLELLTAIYDSSQTGRAVDLPIKPDHPRFKGWLPTR
jgi:predicted dehydrogenase